MAQQLRVFAALPEFGSQHPNWVIHNCLQLQPWEEGGVMPSGGHQRHLYMHAIH